MKLEKRELRKLPVPAASPNVIKAFEESGKDFVMTGYENKKILHLTVFQQIENTVKAEFRVFISKTDYITLDVNMSRTGGKTKWYTGAFENLHQVVENVSAYKWWRHYKDIVEVIPDTKKIIKEFLSKQCGIENDDIWNGLKIYQNCIRQARLDAKHKKETDEIDVIMDSLPEVPEKVKELGENSEVLIGCIQNYYNGFVLRLFGGGSERYRIFYANGSGVIRPKQNGQTGDPVRMGFYEWANYKQTNVMRWCRVKDKWDFCGKFILYPYTLPDAWAHTKMKYCAFEILAENYAVPINYIGGMHRYINFPKIEHIIKIGLYKLAAEYLNTECYGADRLNEDGKTVYEILMLKKENVRIMQEINGGYKELILLRTAELMGFSWKPHELKEFAEIYGINRNFAQQFRRGGITYHKFRCFSEREWRKYIPNGSRIRKPERTNECKRNFANDWLDYLQWCEVLGYKIKGNCFPKNFKAVHDRTAIEFQELQDKKIAEEKAKQEKALRATMQELKAELNKKTGSMEAEKIKGLGLMLVLPSCADEIRAEGAALHHCVGSYVGKVLKGETKIFFVRKTEAPETPYYTMEYKDGKVVQCRGKHNAAMTPQVKAFVTVFEQLMQEKECKTDER